MMELRQLEHELDRLVEQIRETDSAEVQMAQSVIAVLVTTMRLHTRNDHLSLLTIMVGDLARKFHAEIKDELVVHRSLN